MNDFRVNLINRYPQSLEIFHDVEQLNINFTCGEGWSNLLEKTLFNINEEEQYIKEYYKEYKPLKIVQIKEKFGCLRIYFKGGNDFMKGIIRLAESLSSDICEKCGEKGKLRTSDGYHYTACEKHKNG
jgi:hypothetical protein